MKAINAKGRSVLIIGDTHIPFEHPDAWKWLAAIKKKYLNKRSIILHIGDEIDGNQISFHQKDADIPFSPSSELEACIDRIHMPKGIYELFPKMYLCESNHGSLVYRRAKYAGLPAHVIKPYQEILQVKGWEWHEDYLLQTKKGPVYAHHGRGKIGKVVSAMQASSVQGHYHGLHSLEYFRSPVGDRFGCQTGCLVDQKSLAFDYGRLSLTKPILGSLLIKDDGSPFLLTMNLDKNNRWDGTLS